MGIINIGKKDIFWNYFATFLRLASSILLFPVILKFLPAEMVGIYTIFMTVNSFIAILDFGFNPSFTRNITYIFSGAQELQTEGFQIIDTTTEEVNYPLLKCVIKAMIFFYKRIALFSLLMLLTFGSYYIYVILQKYNGDRIEMYYTWIFLCIVSSYNLYMSYLDCLVQGKGLVSLDKKINVLGQMIFLFLSVILIVFAHLNLLSIVIAQFASVLFIRTVLKKKFYNSNKELLNLDNIGSQDKEIIKKIYPNAVKMGLTSLGGILVTRSSIFVGSLYLSLVEVASYGISMQIVGVVGGLSMIYLSTNVPRIVSLRVNNNYNEIQKIYKRSIIYMTGIYTTGLFCIIFLAPQILDILGSRSTLLPSTYLLLIGLGSLIESNVGLSGTILLTKNYVPFFKASLISGASIVLGLFIGFKVYSPSPLILIIIPLLVTIFYQGWKWPYEVIKDLYDRNVKKKFFNL